MKSKSVLVDGYQSVIDNGRNHSVVTDLPDGANVGASALELSVMSLAGCISTIFKKVADKMRLNVERVEVEMDADKGSDTIEKVKYTVRVKSDASEERLKKCLENTEKACPVGVLFSKAGVEMEGTLEKV
ncbi:MAG: OsmC family protein [Bacteroidales bacterium]